MLKLTHDSYHSNAANTAYMSCSLYKSFMTCEARTMAKLNGAWVDEPSIALMVGQYVHSFNDNSRDKFIAKNPSMFKKDLSLKAEFVIADKMIETLSSDEMVMYCLEGEKEVILTVDMFGATWKGMLDVQNIERRRIVDLKTTRSITEKTWSEKDRCKVSFIEAYNYHLQSSLYSEVERIAMNRPEGDYSEFLIVAVSKEKSPDKAIINMTDPERLVRELAEVERNMPRILAVKAGEVEPIRCEMCDFCRSTKTLTKAIHYSEL